MLCPEESVKVEMKTQGWPSESRKESILDCLLTDGPHIYIYKSDCLYLYTYVPAGPISTKFCTDLPTNPGLVLNTSMTVPTPNFKTQMGHGRENFV